MADQKKLLLTLFGVLLILGGLILGAYAIERYSNSQEDFTLAEGQKNDSENLEAGGDLEGAAQKLEWAIELISEAEDKKKTAYMVGGGALLAIIIGAVLLEIRKKSPIV